MNTITWSDVGLLYTAIFGVCGLMVLVWLPINSMFKRKIERNGRRRKLHKSLGWGCAGVLSTVAWFGLAIVVGLAIFVNTGGFR